MIWQPKFAPVISLTRKIKNLRILILDGFSRGTTKSGCANSCLKSSEQGFGSFVRNILPLPPDRRRVVLSDISNQIEGNVQMWGRLRDAQEQPHPSQVQKHHIETTKPVPQRLEISSGNTTLIGDYISTVFPEFHNKWLVQSQGNATFNSTLQLIRDGLVTVDRQYVFFQLGGNQVRSADSTAMFNWVLNLVVCVREKSKGSKIHFIGILPRPIENEDVKVFVMKANRWLANSVDRINKLFGRVVFLPVQLRFLQGNKPVMAMFGEDQLTLSAAGAELFKATTFEMAGFVKNR